MEPLKDQPMSYFYTNLEGLDCGWLEGFRRLLRLLSLCLQRPGRAEEKRKRHQCTAHQTKRRHFDVIHYESPPDP